MSGADSGGSGRWSRRSRARRAARGIAIGCLVLAVLIGGYLAIVDIRRETPRELPPLAGPYGVGRMQLQLITAPTDPTSSRATPRKISVWLWYPASVRRGSPPADYAPGPWRRLHLPGPVGFGQGPFDKLRTRATENATISAGKFGLIVLEPGLGFAAPQYQALAESLASAGFVVAGSTPTHSANLTVIDGRAVSSTTAGNPSDLDTHRGRGSIEAARLVELWAHDATATSKALHEGVLAGTVSRHLHSGTLYVGHSFGGAAALQACANDHSCKGAADLDGTQFGPVLHTGLSHPVLLLGSDNSCITGRCGPHAQHNADDFAAAQAVLRHTRAPATCLILNGAHHFNFTDYSAYYLAEPLARFLAMGRIDGQRALVITSAVVAGFAIDAIGGHPSSLRVANGVSDPGAYPELTKEAC